MGLDLVGSSGSFFVHRAARMSGVAAAVEVLDLLHYQLTHIHHRDKLCEKAEEVKRLLRPESET